MYNQSQNTWHEILTLLEATKENSLRIQTEPFRRYKQHPRNEEKFKSDYFND